MPKSTHRSLSALLVVVVLVILVCVCLSGEANETGAKQHQARDDIELGWLNDYNISPSSRQSTDGAASQVASTTQSTQAVAPYKQPSSWIVGIIKEFFDDIDWKTIEDAREQIEKFIRKVDRLIGSVRSIISKAVPSQQRQSATSDRAASSASGRWWSGGGSKDTSPDLTSVKGMLERVACFVGYVRLMNLSNEALAELDASKVVSQLFNSANKRNSSGWSWFG